MAEYQPKNPREKACYFCNKSEFEWGDAVTGKFVDKNDGKMSFRPVGTNFDDGDASVLARRCEVCGHTVFFSDY